MLTSSIPGLQFFTRGVTANEGLNTASRRETAFVSKVPNAISDELESLRSVSTSRKAESVEASEQRSQKSIEYDDHVPTRCPPPNEPQHWDNVGDDLSSVQVDSNEVLAHVLRRQQDNSLFNFEYSLFSFMLNMPPGRIDEVPNCFASIGETISVVTNFQCANPSHVHVCELFGGEGLTSKLCLWNRP